ncbi:MAG: hypothetical protein JXB50_11430 [Spirochaetes bacterium]|nr:hypothetical protein [Spirochaetota bacterium]
MKKILMICIIYFSVFYVFSQDSTTDIKKDESKQNSSLSETNNQTNKTEVKRKKNGWDYFEEGRYIDSINALLEEKKYFPDRINIYVILGWDYREIKNYIEMERISFEGLRINSEDVRIIKNLAEAYYFQKKYSEAIPYFQKYLSVKYKTNDIYIQTLYYYLGICFFNNNNLYKADISLSTARYFQPNNINILLLLAETKEKLKDYDKSLKLYNNALILSPNNQTALDGINRINSLKK